MVEVKRREKMTSFVMQRAILETRVMGKRWRCGGRLFIKEGNGENGFS